MAANTTPRGQQRDKPFRDALRKLVAEAGEDRDALRDVAIALIGKAKDGDVPAIKEIADRLDGKVPQATTLSGPDEGPVQIEIDDVELARRIAFTLAKAAHSQGNDS